MTGPSNPRREHAGTDPSAPIRHTVDTLNSDALDALYNEIDRLRADIAACRVQQWPQRLGEAEKRLARVRRFHGPVGVVAAAEHGEPPDCAAGCGDWPCATYNAVTAPAQPSWPATAHVYLSTGCLHGDHDYCKNTTGLNGAKKPGVCKQCGAKCICPCHIDPTAREQ